MKKASSEKHSTLRDLNFWIDSYNDLFSDFDPRHFSDRSISDDFIAEMNKLTEEKEGHVKVLRFQIPAKLRDEKTEAVIIDRLPKDFHREYLSIASEFHSNKRKWVLLTILGFIALTSAVLINSLEENKLWQNLLKVLFEPAGWFLIWSGLDKLFFGGKPMQRKRDFYARLEKCKVEFVSI